MMPSNWIVPPRLTLRSLGGLALGVLLIGTLACQAAAEPVLATQAGILLDGLNRPRGVAIDLNDDCYVADSGNGRIIKVSILGDELASWGVQGSGLGQLRNPGGIAVDDNFNVRRRHRQRPHSEVLSGRQTARRVGVRG